MTPRHLHFCFLCALCGSISTTQAQSIRFFGRPAEVFEGDAVVFTYRTDLAGLVPLSQIRSWKWDFNGDNVWDQEITVGDSDPTTGLPITADKISTTWYSAQDESQPVIGGIQQLTPKLQVTYDPDGAGPLAIVTITQTGVTENVFGPDEFDTFGTIIPDPQISVKDRSVGNADLTVNFTANPRLASPTDTVRLYSTVKPAETRTLVSAAYAWSVVKSTGGAPLTSTSANPTFSGLADGSYNVSLTVNYTATYKDDNGVVKTSDIHTLTETKKDAFKVVTVSNHLQLGRAYRRGFPETFGWEDIMTAYQALGPGNDRYVYFNHFQEAFFDKQTVMTGEIARANPANRKEMAEIVNESLQGQSMIANQRLIEALRIKYPRLAATANPDEERLNPPVGAREETAAIDQALLDYQLPLYQAATAIQTYGSDILRTKAPEGAEPYPQFPQYLTILEPTLSQAPIPIKNEYWQLSTALERQSLGRVEKAKKLYRLSAQDSTALEEAKEEAKTAGMQSYLGMALLASGQTERDFQSNEGNQLLAHVKNARDLFERINAGLNPLGNDGSFIPNESFSAIYQDATEAVADAREAEINARQEDRTYEHYQAELRNEHLSQRNSYLTPLKNLTSIDPALYNDLRTVDDQRDYRAVVQSRVEALLKDYPNANPAILGELGSNVVAVLDAGKGVEAARNELINLFARVDLAKWSTTTIRNINQNAANKLIAVDVMRGIAEAFLHDTKGLANTILNFVGGALLGQAGVLETMITTAQQAEIGDVNLEREIRGMLLDAGNLRIAIDRSANNVRQAQLALDNQLSRMDRMIEDLAHTRETAADLYFQDPSFRVVVSQAMRRAEAEMDFAIDRLYRLAKTLEYEWTEGFNNPVIVPVNSQEPASLENPLFDKFTKTDSLFFIRTADEAKDYLDALKAWDSKLRRINVVSVRGPNHSGPITAEPISLRENILNLVPDATRGYTLEKSIGDFRDFLETRRKAGTLNTANPSLEFEFSTTIEDNRFFPATGSRWNMRLHSISAEIYAESGFSDKQVAEIDLIQSGVVSLRRFFADPPIADDLLKMTQNVDDADRTAFSVAFPAKINGATGGRPPTEFENLGLADRPIAATKWILKIDTTNPTNRKIDFTRIKDIVLKFTYTYGNPAEFPNF